MNELRRAYSAEKIGVEDNLVIERYPAQADIETDAPLEVVSNSNTTTLALHSQIAALLNYNNQSEKLASYSELEFGTGSTPDASGCSAPVGRIDVRDPSNEGDTFYMREQADQYELNPPTNSDGTTDPLTEMAAYSDDGNVYNYLTLTNSINKTSDYILVVNLSMTIGTA